MITLLLVHTAIWTQFAASHAVDHLDLRAATQQWKDDLSEDDVRTPPPPVEKIVIRETTLSEKYGLGVESNPRWDSPWDGFRWESNAPLTEQEKEIAAVGANARHLAPTTDWLALRKDFVAQDLKPAVRTDWKKKLTAHWDEDGGFWLGGKYLPPEPVEIRIFSINTGFER